MAINKFKLFIEEHYSQIRKNYFSFENKRRKKVLLFHLHQV
jgi:hypothetical protein